MSDETEDTGIASDLDDAAHATAVATDAETDSDGEAESEEGGYSIDLPEPPKPTGQRTTLQELKQLTPPEVMALAESLEIEGAATQRTQDLLYQILIAKAERGDQIGGGGVLEVLQDGFGFLRSPESNYLSGPDDIYVSPAQIRKFGLRSGDTVEGEVSAP
ncbi:MAG: Rho termination factor N-terminal domain-containing protein, partial [Hyphomonadaceae bacterium]|nr:Rho termination factor N-terminal domain-containing protein [Hyphomonadaceae bacterium]